MLKDYLYIKKKKMMRRVKIKNYDIHFIHFTIDDIHFIHFTIVIYFFLHFCFFHFIEDFYSFEDHGIISLLLSQKDFQIFHGSF